jgi:NAD(P)-dependent dehydrogenase (short-subunit alcohol dehydrogenase family)
MDLDLNGHVVLVTGASAGIGRAAAELLAREGARVVAASRTPVAGPHVRITPVAVDLTAADGPRRLIDKTLDLHGRLDAVVNNVGGLRIHDGFLAIDDDAWAATFELNLTIAVRTTRAALPALIERRGSLVHVASEAARRPAPAIVDYAAAKAALLAVSKGVALEFGSHGVRSNVVSPGPTRTRLWDAPGGFADQLAGQFGLERDSAIEHFVRDVRGLATGRPGTPEDVARVIAYLASPLSAQVTGSEWSVDGGALPQL